MVLYQLNELLRENIIKKIKNNKLNSDLTVMNIYYIHSTATSFN